MAQAKIIGSSAIVLTISAVSVFGADTPIFHDDQHGTAVITLAGLLNALKVVGKRLSEVKIVTSGAGAAGIAIIDGNGIPASGKLEALLRILLDLKTRLCNSRRIGKA